MSLDLVSILIGVCVGGLLGWLIAQRRSSATPDAMAAEHARLTADLDHARRQARLLEEQATREQERTQQALGHMEARFEHLAQRILEDKSERFTQQNRTQLNQLLSPLGDKLDAFKKEVTQAREKTVETTSDLKGQIEQLTRLNQQLSTDAGNLVRALEGQNKVQGDWGEMILERILQESGLREGEEYVTQSSHTTAEGRRLRPDVVVHLPDDRSLIIDAKVSIVAYKRAVEATSDDVQQEAAAAHVRSLRQHVRDLSAKRYHDLPGTNTPAFVLMFIPVEPAFSMALQQDPALYTDAFKRNVVMVSPTTLMATLATIANIWSYEHQNRNAQEIAERGGRLYDKFVLFAEALEEIGDRLKQAQSSYDTARNRLTEGQGNLVRQVELLRELGASTTKDLPPATRRAARLDNGQDAPVELSDEGTS